MCHHQNPSLSSHLPQRWYYLGGQPHRAWTGNQAVVQRPKAWRQEMNQYNFLDDSLSIVQRSPKSHAFRRLIEWFTNQNHRFKVHVIVMIDSQYSVNVGWKHMLGLLFAPCCAFPVAAHLTESTRSWACAIEYRCPYDVGTICCPGCRPSKLIAN